MAKYTIELRTIIESGHNIFSFPYSFYDEEKRSSFEQHFIDHFYFKEIGTETVGRFEHYLKVKFHEVLPFYNMLFNTALIDYNKTQNYNLTETFDRNNTNNTSTTGNATENGTQNNNSNQTNNTSNSQTTNSNLSSDTNNTTDNTFTKEQTIADTNSSEKESTRDTDLKNVESDTPQGLLAMTNIKSNVYASKAVINDNTEKVTDSDKGTALRQDNNSEITHNESNVNVTANSSDTVTGTVNGSLNATNNTTNSNTITNSQAVNGSENESYTKNMKGSYGVITEADMLQKHIDLQKTLSTIEQKFFDECSDLFMMIY